MKKAIVPLVLTIILSIVLILFFENVELTPPVASRQGRSIDTLLRVLFILASIIFSLVMSFLAWWPFGAVLATQRTPHLCMGTFRSRSRGQRYR